MKSKKPLLIIIAAFLVLAALNFTAWISDTTLTFQNLTITPLSSRILLTFDLLIAFIAIYILAFAQKSKVAEKRRKTRRS